MNYIRAAAARLVTGIAGHEHSTPFGTADTVLNPIRSLNLSLAWHRSSAMERNQ
jgi:hypothetical protein